MGNTIAQNPSSSNGGQANRKIINNKKFHVLYQEVVIDKTVDEVWNEVSGNFVDSGEIAHSINESRCLSGDLREGLGAERYLNFNFLGKAREAKERIVEFKEDPDHREFTYHVYEAKGSPATVYNTWTVRKGKDGKTYLSTAFILRAKLAFLTGLIGKKLAQSGSLRDGLLAYKHYLETGEKNVESKRLNELYPL